MSTCITRHGEGTPCAVLPAIPRGTRVAFTWATGPGEGIVVGRHERWLIVELTPYGAPVLVPTASCVTIGEHA